MVTKICSKCKIEKEVCNFHKWKYGPDGYKRICKDCRKSETKVYYKKNGEKIKLNVSVYRKNNEDKVKKLKKRIYERDKKRILMVNKKYRDNNKTKIKLNSKEFRQKNDEKIKQEKKKYYTKNKKQINLKHKIYRENNREKRNEYQKNRKLNDPIFKLNHTIRNRMRSFLLTKNITKKNKTFNIVGCTPVELKEHLEKQFADGMSWDNQGKWHIDHIIPMSSANTEEEVLKLCHYTNLQPLWGIDNLKKGSKLPFN
jgi:hypothetical protein